MFRGFHDHLHNDMILPDPKSTINNNLQLATIRRHHFTALASDQGCHVCLGEVNLDLLFYANFKPISNLALNSNSDSLKFKFTEINIL